ncbi:hypothetical protein BJ508DRAFT_26060 [Ascobolus immersus RN42]|uniref:Uncharacterized protein n=1 Tax=Ascobolus immersus RN42 TaxID=1160509 RepID=A0A3N4IJ34_ASCIM|nr:hypothetical protein BJ508DRAFT_26060 [Ascobolus immersus RN42]
MWPDQQIGVQRRLTRLRTRQGIFLARRKLFISRFSAALAHSAFLRTPPAKLGLGFRGLLGSVEAKVPTSFATILTEENFEEEEKALQTAEIRLGKVRVQCGFWEMFLDAMDSDDNVDCWRDSPKLWEIASQARIAGDATLMHVLRQAPAWLCS